MSKLRQRMIQYMDLRGLSKKTQKAYLSQVIKLTEYFSSPPDQITNEELEQYFLFLTTKKKVSNSLLKQALTSIKFFYKICLKKDWQIFKIIKPKKETKLPTVLSKEEIKRIISVIVNIKHKAIITTMYSGGLRVSEVSCLRINDIHSKRMVIKVEQAKGNKDRYTLLGKKTLKLLRHYWEYYRPKKWLFEGQHNGTHISTRSIQNIFKRACTKAEIKNDMGVHSLRHSFATHLMEAGINLRYIQFLLGHKSPKTTARYTHVCKLDIAKIENPIDTI